MALVLRVAALAAALAVPGAARAQAPAAVPSAPAAVAGLPLEGAPAEEFLRAARVGDRARIGGGLTRPERLTLTDGTRTLRARLLHQLTCNTDYRNPANVLVDPAFRIYAVDSSRAFRIRTDLLESKDLVRLLYP